MAGPTDLERVILVRDDSQVRTIHLNRPGVLNALDRRVRAALLDAIEAIEPGGLIRALVITGSGRAFSSGADLADAGTGDVEKRLLEEYAPLIRAIRAAPVPIIAAVNGVAAGAGVSLAFACDLVVASDDARFVPAFGQLGLVPDAGLSHVLVRALGRHRAAAFLFFGRPMGASEAQRLGLVHALAPASLLLETTARLARELAAGPTVAFGLTKQLLDAAERGDLIGAMRHEARLQAFAAGTADHAEGSRAMVEKRPPRFRGSSE